MQLQPQKRFGLKVRAGFQLLLIFRSNCTKYGAPGSTAGVERQHKVAKRVHTAPRNCMGAGKVEEHVAVTHNSAVARLVLSLERQPFEAHGFGIRK